VNFDEKWKKIEKTGGNTGEFPAGSYLSEPIILAYIISVDISFINLAYFGRFGALMYHIWYG